MSAAIPFPEIDPIVVQFGPLAVRWYGLAYVAGVALAWVWLHRLSRRGTLRITPDQLADLIPWLVVGVIAGGRLGWWLFYHRSAGPEPWWEPLAFWHGGMSFHGGLAGVSLMLVAWCRARRAPFWSTADALTLVAPVGLFFGRIANFINAELIGRPTDLPWGVVFPGAAVARHPSQIYEALLEGPVLLALLWTARRHPALDVPGRTAALFFVGYGLLRALVEFTREPDPQLGFLAAGWITMGQVLSAAIALFGAAVFALLPRAARARA